MEEGYHSNNPYHNAIHATDVTQAMHCFLQEQKVISDANSAFWCRPNDFYFPSQLFHGSTSFRSRYGCELMDLLIYLSARIWAFKSSSLLG